MSDSAEKPNVFFRLLILSATVFVATILIMVMTVFSDADTPMRRWFDEHVGRLMIVEVVVTLGIGVLALSVDRVRTLRQRAGQEDAVAETADASDAVGDDRSGLQPGTRSS